MGIYSTRTLVFLSFISKVIHHRIVYNTKDGEKNKCPSIPCSLVKKNEDTNNKERFLISTIKKKKQQANE